jgi:hypothetical protein
MNTLSLNAMEDVRTDDVSKAPRLGFWKIALAVFAGNVMTGLLAAFLYSLR